jgi:hypothetical protein
MFLPLHLQIFRPAITIKIVDFNGKPAFTICETGNYPIRFWVTQGELMLSL